MNLGKKNTVPAAVVGLDIGHDTIKVAEAKYNKDGSITISALGMAPTPQGVIEDEYILDPSALGQAVKSLLAESGIKTKKCVSSVAGQSKVVTRIIEVPQMGHDELAETVKWEAEKLGFSAADCVIDFHVLETEPDPNADPDAQTMDVLLVVAARDIIDSHVQVLQAAGLKPMAIDIEPLASGRSLINVLGDKIAQDDITAIINVGAENADMSIFEDGLLTFPSPPLGIAGINFTREIAEALGETLEQAEVTKKEHARVDLNAFSVPQQPVQDDAEPTSYGSSTVQFATAFEAEDDANEPEPTTGVQFADFQSIDGEPAVAQDEPDGPSFDVEEEPQQQDFGAPSFDLGEEDSGQPESDGPSFDSGDEPVAAAGVPAFDLGDEEPQQNASQEDPDEPAFETFNPNPFADTSEQEPASPTFDFSDTDPYAVSEEPAPVDEDPATVVHSFGDSIEDKVFGAISGVLADLASEVRRSIDYYNIKYSKMPQRVLLAGGTAKMPHLDEYLTRELGIPVEVANPAKTVDVSATGMSSEYLKEVSPMFSVSIGLAIRDMIG